MLPITLSWTSLGRLWAIDVFISKRTDCNIIEMIELNNLSSCYVMVNYFVWIFDNNPQARIANDIIDMRLPNSYTVLYDL